MKRLLFVVVTMFLFCNAKAQTSKESASPTYDLKINGIYYNVISINDLTLCAVGRVDTTATTLKVPETVEYGERVFSVPKVDMQNSCSTVRTLILPNNLEYLHIDGCEVEDLHLSAKVISGFQHCPQLKRLTISANTRQITNKAFSRCDLDELVFEDGNTILEPDGSVFNYTQVDSVYCGRNFAEIGNYNNNSFGLSICSISAICFGPSVTRIEGGMIAGTKCLDIPENIIEIYGNGSFGRLEEINIFSKNAYFVRSGDYIPSMLSDIPTLKKVYINTIEYPSSFIDEMECEEFVIGTDVTSLYYSTDISVTGNNAKVKVLNRTPPRAPQFTNETFLFTPLYVPRGSLIVYQAADGWRNFFNIVEFDWDEPYEDYEISVSSNNPEYGSVEGGGIYHYGDYVTVTATTNFGYGFIGWKESGSVVSSMNPYSFYVDSNRFLTAVFAKMISVTAISNNVEYGVVEGSGEYPYGATVSLRAIPTPGNSFVHWSENGYTFTGSPISSQISFPVYGDRTITAVFQQGIEVDENALSDIKVVTENRSIHIEGMEDTSKIIVYNMRGQKIYEGKDNKIMVYGAGIYIVAIENRRIKVVVE